MMRRVTASSSVGIESISMRRREAASSIRSIALSGKEAVLDVAIRQRRRRDDRGVLDADAVVHLVALLQSAENRDRVLDARLLHQHGLEAPLERGLSFLDVLAVLVQRRRADAVQFARAPAPA